MNKTEFVNKLASELNITQKKAAEVVATYHRLIVETLVNGESVLFQGHGHYGVTLKKGRRCKNPQTGENIMTEPRNVPTFRFSDILKKEIQENLPVIEN